MTKVKRITVTNVKAIEHEEVILDGATVIVFASNDSGKSTLLDALKQRLLGLKADHIVRRGETNGLYEMEFTTGEVINWEVNTTTKAGEKLTLITSNGEKESAITKIIKWFEPTSFSIDEFLVMGPAKQRKRTEELLGIDLSGIDARYKTAFEDRKFANKKLAELKLFPIVVDETLPAEKLPMEDLQKKLYTVEQHNDKVTATEQQIAYADTQAAKNRAEIARMEAAIAGLKTANETLNAQCETWEIWIEQNPAIGALELEGLKFELQALTTKNASIQLNENAKAQQKNVVAAEQDAHTKNVKILDIEKERDEMIRATPLPAGFAFTDEGLTYKGFPLTREQLSTSSLYIAALKLAAISVGRVRMLHFEASSLDRNSITEVQKWAESEDLQLLIEKASWDREDIRYEIVESAS